MNTKHSVAEDFYIYWSLFLFLIPAWLLLFQFCDNILKRISSFTAYNNKCNMLPLGFYFLASRYYKMATSIEHGIILLRVS